VWESICVSSCVFAYRQTVDYFFNLSVDADMDWLREYIIHDFGYRSTGTEEGATVTSAAQLLLSKGSDSVPAREYVIRMLGAKRESDIMASPPASEHAVACSYGLDRAGEREYKIKMLTTYDGVKSLVADSKNVYDFVTESAEDEEIKDLILTREGKTVFRPDSGNPEDVICGDRNAPVGSKEWKGVLQLLDEGFGHTVNKKGYKVLNEKIGLIYGDGMFLQRYVRTVLRMLFMGYSAENLIIGVGGILRMHTRDTLGVALKDLWMVIDGVPTDIQKDPITDPGKKSHKGLPALILNKDGDHETVDGCTMEQFEASLLVPAFRDGKVLYDPDFAASRVRANAGLAKYKMTKADIMKIADYA
jgi:nicotinamide phosphoribosyltransferase